MQNNINSGVTGHSTPEIWQEFVIFSIDGAELTKLDANRVAKDFEHYCSLHDIQPVQLFGSYEGVLEYSWILPADVFFRTGKGNEIAALWCNNQESVLHLSKPEKRARQWRDATLLFLPSNSSGLKPIGKFKQVKESEARKHIAWTHNPNTNAYYICE